MSEQQARAAFKAESYVLVRFKISKGNCHEFYAIGHDGGVTEAYIHPVTGATVRSTHIPASLTAPASSPTGPATPAAPAPVPAGRSSATPVIHSSFYFQRKNNHEHHRPTHPSGHHPQRRHAIHGPLPATAPLWWRCIG